MKYIRGIQLSISRNNDRQVQILTRFKSNEIKADYCLFIHICKNNFKNDLFQIFNVPDHMKMLFGPRPEDYQSTSNRPAISFEEPIINEPGTSTQDQPNEYIDYTQLDEATVYIGVIVKIHRMESGVECTHISTKICQMFEMNLDNYNMMPEDDMTSYIYLNIKIEIRIRKCDSVVTSLKFSVVQLFDGRGNEISRSNFNICTRNIEMAVKLNIKNWTSIVEECININKSKHVQHFGGIHFEPDVDDMSRKVVTLIISFKLSIYCDGFISYLMVVNKKSDRRILSYEKLSSLRRYVKSLGDADDGCRLPLTCKTVITEFV